MVPVRTPLRALLASLGIVGDPQQSGHLRLVANAAGTLVQIDSDGFAGAGLPRTLVTLSGVQPGQLSGQNFAY